MGCEFCEAPEMASRSTEQRHHGNPQLKASGEVAPTICADTSPRTWDPTTVQQEARRRVVSLEAALQAMGDFQGPEVDVLKNSL